MQNTAASLLTGKRKHDHIILVLSSQHWPPVGVWIDFKVVLLVLKVLNGQATTALRSSNQLPLDIPISWISLYPGSKPKGTELSR